MVELNLNDIYKSIGGLTAEVQGLRRDMETSERRASLGNREADEKRAVVHRRMDEIVSEIGELKLKLRPLPNRSRTARR